MTTNDLPTQPEAESREKACPSCMADFIREGKAEPGDLCPQCSLRSRNGAEPRRDDDWTTGIPNRDGRYLWRSKECPEPGEIELFSNQRYAGHPNLVSIESSEADDNDSNFCRLCIEDLLGVKHSAGHGWDYVLERLESRFVAATKEGEALLRVPVDDPTKPIKEGHAVDCICTRCLELAEAEMRGYKEGRADLATSVPDETAEALAQKIADAVGFDAAVRLDANGTTVADLITSALAAKGE